MRNDFEQLDLRTLMELYLQETKEFAAALGRGASWHELEHKKLRIRELNACISRKYGSDTTKGQRSRDDRPPHGD